MSELPQYQFWIGLAFAILLVAFFIAAFFVKDQLSAGQLQILRFLASLCAAFSGALITGDALAKADIQIGTAGSLAISGTAGVALFILVWLTFDRTVMPPDAYHITIPNGINFKTGVDVIASSEGAVAELIDFSSVETSATLRSQELHCQSPEEALRLLRNLAQPEIRPYEVNRTGALFTLRVK